MNLLTKQNHFPYAEAIQPDQRTNVSVTELIQDLISQFSHLWWSCRKDFPPLPHNYSPGEQNANETMLENLINGLEYEMKHLPVEEEGRQKQADQLKTQGQQFLSGILHLERQQIDFIERSGMLEAAEEFARMARAFDPNLSAADIYQAGRNVMTMNLIQLLLNLPVAVTPSIFAYSLLYPYTDNYLDDPEISPATKQAFNHRFQHRLTGEAIQPSNQNEAVIDTLVGMIETQWERARYPGVYESLLAIHSAQGKSLGMAVPTASPYELDVLGISFEKGGASVLADGFLVAGRVNPEQAASMFGYGAFTQLMDDLEDVQEDLKNGQQTFFSQSARRWPLDNLTNRVFHFGKAIFHDLGAFQSPAVDPIKKIMDCAVAPLLMNSIGLAGSLYSKNYLRQVEGHFPFHFGALHRQQKKLERKKINLERLINTFILRG